MKCASDLRFRNLRRVRAFVRWLWFRNLIRLRAFNPIIRHLAFAR